MEIFLLGKDKVKETLTDELGRLRIRHVTSVREEGSLLMSFLTYFISEIESRTVSSCTSLPFDDNEVVSTSGNLKILVKYVRVYVCS